MESQEECQKESQKILLNAIVEGISSFCKMPSGTEFELSDLFPNTWKNIKSPTSFGTTFKQKILNNLQTVMEPLGVPEKGDNHNKYKKK